MNEWVEPQFTKALDNQVGGSHYKNMKIGPTEFAHVNGLKAFETLVVRYVCRHRNKGRAQDIRKAMHCLECILELDYPDDVTK